MRKLNIRYNNKPPTELFLWEALLSVHQITYRLCNFFAVCANIIDFLLRMIDNYYKY